MAYINCYRPPKPGVWKGRIDDSDNWEAFRWHQIVRCINLCEPKPIDSNKSSQKIGFIGFCCDEGVKRNKGRPGAVGGPDAIRNELSNLPCRFDELTEIHEFGDIICPDGDLAKSQSALSEVVERLILDHVFPIVLGGGHGIALGHFRGILGALRNEITKPAIGIINFDAHFDLRPYNPTPNSGSMFLQIADLCKSMGIPFSYFCLGIQKSANTISLFKKAEKIGVRYILAKDVSDSSTDDIKKALGEFISEQDAVYFTVCADVFSSAFAPGVSTPQPFGLFPEKTIKLIKHVINSKKVLGFDIAEVSPCWDHGNITSRLAAVVIFAVVNTLFGDHDSIS